MSLDQSQTKAMCELTSVEMQHVQGGAQVDYFLKLATVEGECTSRRLPDDVVVDGRIITGNDF